jgi:hypothetical protein
MDFHNNNKNVWYLFVAKLLKLFKIKQEFNNRSIGNFKKSHKKVMYENHVTNWYMYLKPTDYEKGKLIPYVLDLKTIWLLLEILTIGNLCAI